MPQLDRLGLTTVQLEIILYLANGDTYEEIAAKTHYTARTLRKKIEQARSAAQARTTEHLISLVIAYDLLVWEPEDQERVLASDMA